MSEKTREPFFGRHRLRIHALTCGYGPALEHNGDLYSCDHFVEPKYKLGNIHETHMLTLVASPEQRKFGDDKRDALTAQCRGCKVRNWCNGGCPKDRFALSKDGEPGQNYLCPGLELFFTHTGPAFSVMAQLFRNGRAPADVMAWIAVEDAKRGPFQPCACCSGKKFRSCHGARAHPAERRGRRLVAVASTAASESTVHVGTGAAVAADTRRATS